MKQKDIAMIIIVAFFAGLVSFFGSNALFGSKTRNLSAEKVDKITSDFTDPDPTVFNKNAINPTKLIQIGDSSNPKPF